MESAKVRASTIMSPCSHSEPNTTKNSIRSGVLMNESLRSLSGLYEGIVDVGLGPAMSAKAVDAIRVVKMCFMSMSLNINLSVVRVRFGTFLTFQHA